MNFNHEAIKNTINIRPASEDPQLKRHSYVVNQNIDFERFDLERHSVRNLVQHYSKVCAERCANLMRATNSQCVSPSRTKVAPPSEELIGAAGAGGLSYLHQQKKQREETKRRHAEMSMGEPDQMPAYQGSIIV